MIGNSVKCDLPETLFTPGDEEDPKTGTRVKTKPPPEDASPEFKALIAGVTKKVERRKARPKTIAAADFGRARLEVKRMMDSGEWDECGARHLVALYDMMHEKCYGVAPAELGPAERFNAAMMASGFVKREFDNDYVKAANYMHWAWTKEINDEKWRRANARLNARRIGVRLMFGGALLTDYRVFLARTRQET